MNNPDNEQDQVIYCDLCCLTPSGLRWNEWAQPAVWDAPTRDGPWAYVCKRHAHAVITAAGTKLKQAKVRSRD
jgi:hypothetical protein